VPLSEEPASARRSPVAQRRPNWQRHEKDLPAVRQTAKLHPDLERAFVAGLWLLAGLVCTFMAIGAVVEFARASYVWSFTFAICASGVPASVIAVAIDGWFKQRRWKNGQQI
jgi:hypothetical protein